MMQTFWDTSMQLGPTDDYEDTRSEGSMKPTSDGVEIGRSFLYSLQPHTFSFKYEDRRGRIHWFICVQHAMTPQDVDEMIRGPSEGPITRSRARNLHKGTGALLVRLATMVHEYNKTKWVTIINHEPSQDGCPIGRQGAPMLARARPALGDDARRASAPLGKDGNWPLDVH